MQVEDPDGNLLWLGLQSDEGQACRGLAGWEWRSLARFARHGIADGSGRVILKLGVSGDE